MKKLLKQINIVFFLAVLGGVLLLVNLLAQKRYARLDFTEGKEFTLSAAAKKTLKNLDDVVNLTVFISENLPPQFTQTRTHIQDLLSEFKALAGANLEVRYVDPKGDEKMEEKVQSLGVPQTAFFAVQEDNVQQQLGYLSVAVEYGDAAEVVPKINLDSLEYDLIVALKKVLRTEPLSVVLYKNVEDPEFFDQFAQLTAELQKQYAVDAFDAASGRPFPPDAAAAVVLHPKELTEAQQFDLDQFVMRGGKALFLLDPIEFVTQFNPAEPAMVSGAEGLLDAYGVTVHGELLLDKQFDPITYNVQQVNRFMTMQRMDAYPMWPKFLKQTNSFGESPLLTGIDQIAMRWPGWLEVKHPLPEGVKATELIRSGPESWTVPAPFNLNPQQDYAALMKPESMKPRPVALLLTGRFPSAFKGREAPARSNESGESIPVSMEKLDLSPETSIVVTANCEFIRDMFLGQGSPMRPNLTFVQNAVDQLTIGGDLMQVRARGVKQRPLKKVESKTKKRLITYGNIFGMPLAVAVFGIAATVVRQGRKKSFIASMGGR